MGIVWRWLLTLWLLWWELNIPPVPDRTSNTLTSFVQLVKFLIELNLWVNLNMDNSDL
jgi:hypothetical protein